MEQHPIPRQITSFEFKLIGFMTLKQFLYLLVSVPTGFIVFKLFPIPLINAVLGVLVASVGVAFAFIPINDRPMDVWVKNMIKRLNSPTQFTFYKQNSPLYFIEDLFFVSDPHKVISHVESKEKLAAYLEKTQPKKPSSVKKKQIQSLLQTPTTQISPQPILSQVNTTPRINTLVKVQSHPQVVNVQPEKSQIIVPTPSSKSPKQLSHTFIPKDFNQPVVITSVVSTVPTPTSTPAEPAVVKQTVQQIPIESLKVAPQVTQPPSAIVYTPPSQTAPVVIPQARSMEHPSLTGVIKNNRKIPLPGVLVYIKNKQGVSLRLLKTNPHGIFATYNPLPEGDYVFEMKDPNGGYFFDTMNVHVPNTGNKPYEFYSKESI